jgi:hypothetical protein
MLSVPQRRRVKIGFLLHPEFGILIFDLTAKGTADAQ